jgi:hypothetical protein
LILHRTHAEGGFAMNIERSRSRHAGNARRALIEPVEARRLLTMIPVTTLADSGAGSLRDAIAQANAMAGDDVIEFAAGLTGTVNLASALPVLSSNIEVHGPGPGLLTVRRNATASFRIVTIGAGATVTLSGLTISNGLVLTASESDGGGVFNRGSLTLVDCAVSGNTAFSSGGGINSGGALTLTNTTVSGNRAGSTGGGIYAFGTVRLNDSTISSNRADTSTASGGGIYNASGTVDLSNCRIVGNFAAAEGGGVVNNTPGTMTFSSCTIDTNSTEFSGAGLMNHGIARLTNCTASANCGSGKAGLGGAIRNGGTLTVVNSTISGNLAQFQGGAILNHGPLTLTNCTVTDNRASGPGAVGGGLFNTASAATTLNNTIVAGNFRVTGAGSTGDDVHLSSGTVSGSFNVVGVVNATISGGSNHIGVDPRLGPLADNGGATRTHALHLSSPAIDGGSNALAVDAQGKPLTTDQRGAGFNRVVGTAVEIGAWEAQTRAPDVLQSTFHFATLPMTLRVAFNSNVSGSLDLGDILVRNLTTQTTVNPTSLAYDVATDTATFEFSGVLPDGNYRATIFAAGVIGSNGLPMTQDEVFDFFFLVGDANHDRLVNLADFNALAANFGQSGRDFTQGDFNYDSLVNLDDFNILAGRFGQGLPALATPDALFAWPRAPRSLAMDDVPDDILD